MAVGVINFPTSLDDLDTLIRAENNAVTTLASGISAGATTIPLVSATKFTASGIATIIDNPAGPTLIEIFTYTGKSSNDLTGAGRGAYGTIASAFSAGATVVMRPVARHHIALVEAILELEKKVGYSAAVLRPQDVSGTNITGNNYDITGGPGTGNAEPGIFGVRYPLRGASGTALQALSADRFPPVVGLYTNTGLGTQTTNNAAEVSMFNGLPVSAGSTRTLEGGITKAGTIYRIRLEGDFNTTGSPTIQFKIKLGATIISDTGVLAAPTNNAGRFLLEYFLNMYTIGATASVRSQLHGQIVTPANGFATGVATLKRVDQTAADITVSQTVDVTAQFGTAAAGNNWQTSLALIERIR